MGFRLRFGSCEELDEGDREARRIEVIDLVAEILAEAAPDAERHGVTICLETHDAFCRGEEVAGVLRQIDSPYVKAVWDVHHPYRMGEAVEDTWNFIGARLAHVHMKDARRREDGSWELKLMGEGEVPCREILSPWFSF